MHINLSMTISFRQMRLFLALADTGSVTAAARACHVTQPTASMQLREITDTVGVPLYEVISRRVHLTDAGHDLARTVRSISDEWDAFEQRIDGVKGLARGRLRLGGSPQRALGQRTSDEGQHISEILLLRKCPCGGEDDGGGATALQRA